MRILITNDDGIDALGIKLLVDWARKLGEVTVVAPKVEQSGKSHGIELMRSMEVLKRDIFDGIEAYSVDSTPADCVRFGVRGLKKDYDLILSGINRGANLGKDIVYSGTVGAIMEATVWGINAIAFSTFPDSLEEAAKYLDTAYDYIISNSLFDLNSIYNINIPAHADGICITRQGESCYPDEFVCVEGNMWKQVGVYVPDSDQSDMTLDAVAALHGKISITPMQSGRTNIEVFKSLISK